MKDAPKKRCIPFLQAYARIERQKAIEDFDRKMKLWRWIHDTSENAPPPDFGDGERPAKTPKAVKVSKGTTKSPKTSKVPKAKLKGKSKEPKESSEVKRRRSGPRVKNVDEQQPSATLKPASSGAAQWKARNRREANKRVSRPSRIMREREDSDDWTPPTPTPPPLPKPTGEHKRIRLTYSEEQVEILRGAFEREQYATREIKEELSERTGLTVTQVNKWFENRRKRERDERKAHEGN